MLDHSRDHTYLYYRHPNKNSVLAPDYYKKLEKYMFFFKLKEHDVRVCLVLVGSTLQFSENQAQLFQPE